MQLQQQESARWKRACCAGLLWLLATSCQASVLVVEAGDQATVERDQRTLSASSELVLRSGDRVLSGEAPVNLLLARHGRIDIAEATVLAVESLPHATFASDLRTVFRLLKGGIHVVWKHPQLSMRWPLHVRFGEFGATLSPGEYFIRFASHDNLPPEACVVDGRLTVTRANGPSVDTLSEPGCYALDAKAVKPAASEQAEGDWAARRQAMRAAPAKRRALPVVPVAAPLVAPAVRLPRPAEDTGPQGSATGRWFVNVASLRILESAEKIARELESAGHETRVIQAEVDGQRWYRVQVGSFDRVVDARRVAEKLAEDFGFRNAWVVAR